MEAPEFEVRPATDKHARELAPRMRKADAVEVLASSGLAPLEALQISLGVSTHARSLFLGGELAAMFGCAPLEAEGVGCVWMLGSDLVSKRRRGFWRACGPEVAQMLELFPVLANAVSCANAASLRWLRRMGAEFQAPLPFGKAQLPFMVFTLRKEHFHHV